jgi:nucleoside-diphosphate-sugar epimerase
MMARAEHATAIQRHPLRGQKILITGASGFIGSHVCRRLSDGATELHAISRTGRISEDTSLRWWQGDLADATTARDLLKAVRPDVIFHLASYVKGARGLEHVLPTFNSNLASTVNLLTAASEVGCRRIVLSNSLEECDAGGGECVPSSPYAAAKWASSGYARMFHALYRLPVVILRVFMVYGPAQQDATKLIPYVILSLLRGEVPKLTSGQREVDWIYVDDVVEGLLAAAVADGVEGSTIDIGSGQLTAIRAVVEELVRLDGGRIQPVFGALADRPLEQVRVADIARSWTRMGWKPTIPLHDGLERTIAWYRDQARASGAPDRDRVSAI